MILYGLGLHLKCQVFCLKLVTSDNCSTSPFCKHLHLESQLASKVSNRSVNYAKYIVIMFDLIQLCVRHQGELQKFEGRLKKIPTEVSSNKSKVLPAFIVFLNNVNSFMLDLQC